jgi:hypothetical protein
MDPRISQVFAAFHRAVLDAVAQVLPHSDATFMVCSYLVSAVDGLSGYRYRPSEHLGKRGEEVVGARFAHFLRDYFPSSYAGHAERLYVFRCRALHNFSPAHFSLTLGGRAKPASDGRLKTGQRS